MDKNHEGIRKPFRKRGRRYWWNLGRFTLASCLVGVLFIQYVGLPILTARQYAHPYRLPVCCYTPDDLGLTYEDAAFTTRDGLTLKGWYIPSRNRAAVILLHSLSSNRMGMLPVAQILARHGYGILLFDLRAQGDSEGELLPFGGPEIEDVRAALAYLQTRSDIDAEKVGVMGWSLGAQIGILSASQVPGIKAVVADGTGATALDDWLPPRSLKEWLYVPFDLVFYQVMPLYTGIQHPLPIKQAIRQISPVPIFLISSGFEFEQHRAEGFYAAAGEPKSLWVIPEAGHLEGLSKRPQEYEVRVVEFFDQALLGD